MIPAVVTWNERWEEAFAAWCARVASAERVERALLGGPRYALTAWTKEVAEQFVFLGRCDLHEKSNAMRDVRCDVYFRPRLTQIHNANLIAIWSDSHYTEAAVSGTPYEHIAMPRRLALQWGRRRAIELGLWKP